MDVLWVGNVCTTAEPAVNFSMSGEFQASSATNAELSLRGG